MADQAAPRGAQVGGTVLAILPRALYRIDVGQGHEVIAHAPTGPGRSFVRLLVGDRVTVELSGRDWRRGRIIGKREDHDRRAGAFLQKAED